MPDAPAGAINTIVVVIGGRKIAWKVSDTVAATIAQGLAQTLGPGEEVE